MIRGKWGNAAMKFTMLDRLAKIIGAIAIAAAITLSAGAANAAEFDDGWRAYEAGDFATALKVWGDLAAKGDARAQFNLGVLYDDGRGVAENTQTAIGWWQKAAENGYRQAQHNLGLVYLFGRGAERDYASTSRNTASARCISRVSE
jgi:TPR repeat protein